MKEWKDKIRLSLGLIQEQNGNSFILEKLTDLLLKRFYGQIKHYEGELWTRNSYNFNAYIPLLSDLDLTLLYSSTETARKLETSRKKFGIIGEINFYHPRIQADLIKLANPYELSRDPLLVKRLNLTIEKSRAQYIVFIIRQLQSDQKWLRTFPTVRVKKWRYLYELLESPFPGIPSHKKILSLVDKKIADNTDEYFSLPINANPYEYGLNHSWKYLFPQLHIWKETAGEMQTYIQSLNALEKEILTEQIKWEFWGVGCHHYWINPEISIKHLSGFLPVAEILNFNSSDMNSMQNILHFIQRLKR